jgi:hypothetical protein
MADNSHVVVTIADKALEHFSSMVDKLRKAGLKVRTKMENVGMVRGEVPQEKLAALKQIDGVDNVHVEQEIRLSPLEQ